MVGGTIQLGKTGPAVPVPDDRDQPPGEELQVVVVEEEGAWWVGGCSRRLTLQASRLAASRAWRPGPWWRRRRC